MYKPTFTLRSDESDVVSLIEDTALGSLKLSRLLNQPAGV